MIFFVTWTPKVCKMQSCSIQRSKENTNIKKGGRGEFNKPDMDAWCTKVAGNKNTVSRWPHCCQEARSFHIHRHEVWEWLFPETLDDILVVLQHISWHATVETVGHLDSIVNRVLHQGPGGEGGPRHHDGAVKQAWFINDLFNKDWKLSLLLLVQMWLNMQFHVLDIKSLLL